MSARSDGTTPSTSTDGYQSVEQQGDPGQPGGPRRRVGRMGIIVAGVFGIALVVGIVPRVARQRRLAATLESTKAALSVVSVTTARRAASASTVDLPGTLAALQTAAIYARVQGYVHPRFADIGARVRAGERLAEIEAPDLDQQVAQARGTVAQNRAALQLARANLARWITLAADSVVTPQELDQMRAAFNMAVANLNGAVANLKRLLQLQEYEHVAAPFTGVITARNVDVGALVGTAGGVNSTPPSGAGSPPGSLFTLARTDTLRVYINVPEEYATAVQIGKEAVVTVPELPDDTLRGMVVRTARALDPTARTLLTEVNVANPTTAILPGMYAQVRLLLGRVATPLRVPATALVIRSGPPQVATVAPDSTIRYRTIQIGRDHGSWVEVTGGLAEGTAIVLNPGIDLRDQERVRTIPADTTMVPSDTMLTPSDTPASGTRPAATGATP